jgi:hypothetical protein
MADNKAQVAGKIGPLRSPMASNGSLPNTGTLRPPTGANTTIPGTAPNAAPIRSPLAGNVNMAKNWKA